MSTTSTTTTTTTTTPPPTTTTPHQGCLHRNVTATMLGDPEIWWHWSPDGDEIQQQYLTV